MYVNSLENGRLADPDIIPRSDMGIHCLLRYVCPSLCFKHSNNVKKVFCESAKYKSSAERGNIRP